MTAVRTSGDRVGEEGASHEEHASDSSHACKHAESISTKHAESISTSKNPESDSASTYIVNLFCISDR